MSTHRKKSKLLIIILVIVLAAAVGATAFIMYMPQKGKEAFDKGLQLYAYGDYEEAAEYFKEAEEASNDNAEIRLNRAIALSMSEKYDEAEGIYRALMNEADEDQFKYEICYAWGISNMKRASYSEAVLKLEEALLYNNGEYKARDIEILSDIAEAYVKLGEMQNAVSTYSRILNVTEDADVYLLRGRAYSAEGEFDSAAKDISKAISLKDASYDLYIELYNVYNAAGKEDEAENALHEAAKLPVRTANDMINKGMISLYEGDEVTADSCFQDAYDKGEHYGLACLGASKSEQGRFEEAIEDIGNYLSKAGDPAERDAMVYNAYGYALYMTGDKEKAKEAFEAGLELNDPYYSKSIMLNLVGIYEEERDWDSAYDMIMKLYEKFPDDERVLREKALIESRRS